MNGAPFLFSSLLVLSPLARPLRLLRDARILHIGGISRQGRRRGVRDHANPDARTNIRRHTVTVTYLCLSFCLPLSSFLFLFLSFCFFRKKNKENRKSPEKDWQRERQEIFGGTKPTGGRDQILARAARAPVKSTVSTFTFSSYTTRPALAGT